MKKTNNMLIAATVVLLSAGANAKESKDAVQSFNEAKAAVLETTSEYFQFKQENNEIKITSEKANFSVNIDSGQIHKIDSFGEKLLVGGTGGYIVTTFSPSVPLRKTLKKASRYAFLAGLGLEIAMDDNDVMNYENIWGVVIAGFNYGYDSVNGKNETLNAATVELGKKLGVSSLDASLFVKDTLDKSSIEELVMIRKKVEDNVTDPVARETTLGLIDIALEAKTEAKAKEEASK